MSNNLGVVVKKYPSGTLRKFQTESGHEFQAYVPDNYNSDTNVILYEHGDNGYISNWNSFDNRIESDECNSIIIRADRNNSTSLYNYIVDQYGLNETSRVNVSFSGGTIYSIKETAEMIKQNPNVAPPISVIVDGYVPTQYLASTGIIDTLKKSNAIVLAFGGPVKSYLEEYYALARTGVNVVILKDKSAFGASHDVISTSFMEGGLYEYSIGKAKLPNRYEILAYNQESDSFIPLDYNDASTLNSVYNYFGISSYSKKTPNFKETNFLRDFSIVSDSFYVKLYLDPIVSAIKNTHLYNDNIATSGFSSTTQVPSYIPDAIQHYFSNVSKVLNNIANLTADIAKIEENYTKADKALISYGESINLFNSPIKNAEETTNKTTYNVTSDSTDDII